LQLVTTERFFHRSANTECGARLDVRAQGFWGAHHQHVFFDVCVSIIWQLQIVAFLLPVAFNHMIEKSVGLMNNVFMK